MLAAFAACLLHAASPQEVYERAIEAKGGRARLHAVHSLAVYMKPAEVTLPGVLTNWLCVFPDRYFEFEGLGGPRQQAMVVDASANRVAVDLTGALRKSRELTRAERDRLALNQIVFLLESAWLQPQPVELRHNTLILEAAGRTYKVFLNGAGLPERVLSPPPPSQKPKTTYDYRLQRYRDFQGVMLPARITSSNGIREGTWDVDYEVEAKYNPKLFDRLPDLNDGPEPWRRR